MTITITGEFDNLAALQRALFQLANGVGDMKRLHDPMPAGSPPSLPERMQTTGILGATLIASFPHTEQL